MKKQLMFLLVCLGLIMPGSSLITGLNAQTKSKRTARTPLTQKNPQKAQSPNKLAGVQRIAAGRKSGSLAAGDPCSTDVPITLGQPINATLDSGTDCLLDDGTLIDFYSFSGTAGQPIAISQISNDFDTYLYLFDDTGAVVDANDDSGTTTDSRIPVDGGVITLPYTGDYFIGANSYDPSTGAYTISLNTDASCTTTAITYNQTVNGTLATADCAVNIGGEPFYTDLYTFNGTAGQQISIAMNSTAVNSYLVLHTPSGAGSLDDDDSGGGQNARIPASGTFTLPESGTYTIEASSFNSFEVGAYSLVVTGPTVVPSSNKFFDYDGDGKADLSVFRPSTATWYIQNSSASGSFNIQNFGLSSDAITPADFDGDGKTDIAVFRASEGNWYSLNTATNTTAIVNFGTNGDVAVPADFDGDGKSDYAIFRPSTGDWWILGSATSGVSTVNFGLAGDKPTLGDFDGDGKNDIAVFRPSTGIWYRLNSSNAQVFAYQFGLASDLPTPADFDGDSKTDIAVYRPLQGTWYIVNSSNNTITITNFGLAEDKPVAADYDGDGKADIAVFRPSSSVWYLQRSTAGFVAQPFGLAGDNPTPSAFVR
jgi:FG-GAP-like repeat/Bacterial pre-peptidase C-terminal domain/FG-GAP repeat